MLANDRTLGPLPPRSTCVLFPDGIGEQRTPGRRPPEVHSGAYRLISVAFTAGSIIKNLSLDRDARTLLRVEVGDVQGADDIFSKLMGDVVEPRREFIQNNALSVANLDV